MTDEDAAKAIESLEEKIDALEKRQSDLHSRIALKRAQIRSVEASAEAFGELTKSLHKS